MSHQGQSSSEEGTLAPVPPWGAEVCLPHAFVPGGMSAIDSFGKELKTGTCRTLDIPRETRHLFLEDKKL